MIRSGSGSESLEVSSLHYRPQVTRSASDANPSRGPQTRSGFCYHTRMIITGIPAHRRGRLPETVPLGGAGSGFLRLWLVPSLAGVVGQGPRRQMPRWSAERRDVPIARDVKTPRKRLPRASQARNGCLASTPRLPALRSPFARRRGSRKGHYGAAGAAKQTAGGAILVSTIRNARIIHPRF